MGEMAGQSTKPGRPRDPHADESILAAARDLLAAGGLANLTVEATAQQAGVAKTTVYRRYPTKLDLAIAAVAALVGPPPDSDDVEGRVREGLDLFAKALGSPGSQAAYLAVAAAAATDPELHGRFTDEVLERVGEQVADGLRSARERGEASEDASVDFCFDVMIGALIHRFVIRQLPPDQAFLEDFTILTRFLYQGCPRQV
jgi:AcrR family transcriptional regulator